MKGSKHVFEKKPFPVALIQDLVCPYCGSDIKIGFEVQASSAGLTAGTLQCDCYEYPVVDGIAVLRQMSPVFSTRNEAVDRLKENNPNEALLSLLEKGIAAGVPSISELRMQRSGWARVVGRIRRLLRKRFPALPGLQIPLEEGFESALRGSRPRYYADYLYYRFANPSLLGAIPPILLFGDVCRKNPRGRVLDLLCGVGHTSSILGAYFPEIEVIAADFDFVNLFLVKHFVAPGAVALCVDAELPMPFKDLSFDGLFCLDGLHYVRSKIALLSEVDRIVHREGIWCFAHMHNANEKNVNAGAPLSAKGYEERFAFAQYRFMSELEILQNFQTSGSLDLTSPAAIESLNSCHALTLLGGRNGNFCRRFTGLDNALCRRPDLIEFNPIYKVEGAKNGVELRAVWPSESLRQECVGEASVIPETVHIPARVVEGIKALKSTGAFSDEIKNLMRLFVLVSLPKCYPRTHMLSTELNANGD